MNFLIVDDHALFSEGLQFVIEGSVDNAVCQLAASVAEAKAKLERQVFDMILVDLNMPGVDGLAFIKSEMDQESLVPMLVLSSVEDKHRILQAMQAGARGFISKSCNSSEVVRAINLVLSGGIYFEDIMVSRTTWIDADTEHDQRLKLYGISERQHEVLNLLKSGLSNKQIAKLLGVSPETIKFHVRILLKALGVNNRVECIGKAKSLNLLD